MIKADGPGDGRGPATFVSYRLKAATIVAVVRKPDGRTETRRYGWNGNGWDRL